MRPTTWKSAAVTAVLLSAGCPSSGNSDDAASTSEDTSATAPTTESTSTSAATSDTTSDATTDPMATTETGRPIFDVGHDTDTDTGGPIDVCKVQEGNGMGTCRDQAPPDSFEPDVQWSWMGEPGEPDSIVTPLVANLTDDNDDGEIDLCDTPDILVVASPDWWMHGHMYLLDGATGAVHFQFPVISPWTVTPAIGDIDDDGIPEIVGAMMDANTPRLVAFEHDGTMKWMSITLPSVGGGGEYPIALADLDNDGDVEIFFGATVVDHLGAMVFTAPDTLAWGGATTAADLDGDGDLELVLGRSAYHHDGSEYFNTAQVPPGNPAVADLDADGEPEILLLTGTSGIAMLEHDGAVKFQGLQPIGTDWYRPPAVHDLDGDNVSEFAVSSGNQYSVYEGDGTLIWSAPVADLSGAASGTAFDFLGDGIAEAIYADELDLFVFDGTGTPLMSTTRSSGTTIEYPVVADVDNDGSAEIVVVSNEYQMASPLVQVIRDIQDRWIQARRIWNQHAYHVTNVREDGTIPQFEQPSWTQLNTFRTNAQIEGGVVCDPEG